MKFIILFALFSLAVCQPINVYRVKADSFEMDQDSDDDVITGSYTWTSPEGIQFFVRYIADHHGFRILDSNALPVSSSGVKVDGHQGSFLDDDDSFERDDYDDDDHDSFEWDD